MGLDGRDGRAEPGREDDDVVAGAPLAARDLARVAAEVVVLVAHRPDDPLHGEPPVRGVAVARDLDRLEPLEERAAVPPRHPLRGLDDVVAGQRRDRDRERVLHAELLAERVELALDRAERLLGELDEVHLVHGEDDVRDAEHRRDVRVAAGLLDHALPRVEQDDRDVRGRRPRDHVARVLDVTGRVGELEAARGVTNERYATSIVIPCSRSARSPSVRSARLT